MRKALKSLKEDESIMILPADKGRASVILDTDVYRAKMSELIESGPYHAIGKDPTDRLSRKLSTILRGFHKNGDIDDSTYRKLKPSQKQPPRIYGLPKIHKADIPLRPIVSCVSSFAYNTSKYLADILAPLVGSNGHAVHNSASFVDFLRSETIQEHEVMVSFDVVSLFTNVPIDAACKVALSRLERDESLPERTQLSPAQVTELLSFVLQSTYFMFAGNFYEQQEGAAMGSPVSAVIANLFMEAFEERALSSCPPDCAPRVWKRYVDDTFIITHRSAADDLLSHMNAQQPSIRFTMEMECNERIAFLDTLVHRDTSGRLYTTVYRKPTHTDQYIAYDSHHPKSVKRGVVKCLYDRASRIVTKPHCTATEKQHITSALISNGYPRSFVNRVAKKKSAPSEQLAQFKSAIVIPFVDGIAHLLRRRLERHGIRVIFKSDSIRSQLVRPKDRPIPDRRDGVVYKIPCSTCDKVYIGETGRPVGERMKEHRRDVRLRRTDSSAVAEHAWDSDHPPNWDEVSCIANDKHWYTRRIKEAIQIRLHPSNINRDSGIEIPDEWLPTIRRHTASTVHSARRPHQRVPDTSADADWPAASANHSARCTPERAPSTSADPDWPAAPANHSAAHARVEPDNSSRRYITRAQQRLCSLPDEV
ncbi:uncharacterized protein LOC121411955 [Lytechinus variegatus]|uniref:uncharacterized protein LOC121411955 n=1 Tax=Lytechinus variegatus TaxID=7654 RepID=UPI001BB220C7|nr:uncharacterized protein LOC121411955 [Lytechinus variegatus]